MELAQDMVRFDSILDRIVATEGGYTNDPADAGGETMWGITIGTAQKYGYTGHMRLMSRDKAKEIYLQQYIIDPGFDEVYLFSPEIGTEVIDTGVNMGQPIAAICLQRCLNAFNGGGKDYPDVIADGHVGPQTIAALHAYLQRRGKSGVTVMLRALNALQGERYIDITEKRPINERFTFGWFLNRVAI